MAGIRESKLKYYYKRKEQGICPRCGEKVIEGSVSCERCKARYRQEYRRHVQRMTAEEIKRRNERVRKYMKEKTHARRAAGLCVYCGEKSPDRYLCEACAMKRKAA